QAVRLYDYRTTSCYRPQNRRRACLRHQLFRIFRLVAVADDLPEQAAAIRKEASRRHRLDARSALCQGLRAVPDAAGACHVDADGPAGSRKDVGGCVMSVYAHSVPALLQRIRSEFMEMPGLNLTLAQAARLWGLDKPTSERLLGELVSSGFLF